MLQELYYKINRLILKRNIRYIGKNVKLRFSSRFIHGEYISIADDVVMSQNLLIAVYPEFANQDMPVKRNNTGVIINQGVSANRNLTIYCADSVVIGRNCMLGSNILITDNDHGINAEDTSYRNQILKTKQTIIEEECWIAQNTCILAGSHIGKRSIIGAGSIVKGDIPPYSIAVGVPATVIRVWDFVNHIWVSVS